MDNKDRLILEMLKDGKSYSDIQAILNVSPSRIIVVKKKNILSSADGVLLSNPTPTPEEKEKADRIIKARSQALELLKLEIKEKAKDHQEYFKDRSDLFKRLKELGYTGRYDGIKISKVTKQQTIRIQLQEYIIKKVSSSEYVLEKGAKLKI